MDIENRHIDLKGLDGTMLLRYIKETSSNEERSSIEAWLEADEGNERILLQTARIYYANNVQERIASRDPLAAYEKLERRLAKRVRRIWLKRFSTVAACVVVTCTGYIGQPLGDHAACAAFCRGNGESLFLQGVHQSLFQTGHILIIHRITQQIIELCGVCAAHFFG